jgi:hypothetical protein
MTHTILDSLAIYPDSEGDIIIQVREAFKYCTLSTNLLFLVFLVFSVPQEKRGGRKKGEVNGALAQVWEGGGW